MSSGLLLKAVLAEAQFSHAFTITPDPNNDLAMPARAIRCGTAGSIVVNTEGGEENVTLNFLAGETRNILVTRVLSATGAVPIEGMA